MKHKPNCKNLFLKHFILLKHFWDLNRFGCKYYWVSVELRAQFKLRISVWVQDSAWVQDSIGAFEHRAPSAPSKLIPNSVAIPGVISLVEVDCARLVRSSLQWSLCHLAPSFFEKVQIGRSGGPEFWVIWKVRDPQDLIFKTPNRGPESPLPSQKSERPSGPHF